MDTNKTYVRRYNSDDIEYMIKVVERELPKLPNYKGVTVDADRLRFVLTTNVGNDGYLVTFLLISELGQIVGALMAYCVCAIFSWDRVCGDVFFYILPPFRTLPNAVKLVKAYKDWAKARKAIIVQFSHTGGNNLERFANMVGFEPVGKLYHLRSE